MHWRQWGDDFVAYSSRSATTHLLSAGAGEVLMVLLAADAGLTVDDLAWHLFSGTGEAPVLLCDAERAALTKIVSELARLELVESRAT